MVAGIKSKKMCGYTFNRQFSFPLDGTNMIVDFISRKLKLIIEVDGYSHNFKQGEDKKRDDLFLKYGYTVLRKKENDVLYDLNNVIRVIEATVLELDDTPLGDSEYIRIG